MLNIINIINIINIVLTLSMNMIDPEENTRHPGDGKGSFLSAVLLYQGLAAFMSPPLRSGSQHLRDAVRCAMREGRGVLREHTYARAHRHGAAWDK